MFRAKSYKIRNENVRLYVPESIALSGTFTKTLILEGDPLHRDNIAVEKPILADVSMSIPTGFRAVAIPVNPESGVEGWVRPGVYVDVVWSTQHRDKKMVSIIVENARVLSAGGVSEEMHKRNMKLAASGQKAPGGGNGGALQARYVTLMVSLEDSQRINLAKTSGALTLSLRGSEDQNAAGDKTFTVEKLLNSRGVVLSDQVTGTVSVAGKHFEVRDDGTFNQMQDEAVKVSPLATSLHGSKNDSVENTAENE